MTTTAPRSALLAVVALLAGLLLAVPAAAADEVPRAVTVTAAAELPPAQAVKGPLPGEPTSRPLGLPAALAVLAVVGVASLQVRVLLAEPVVRDR